MVKPVIHHDNKVFDVNPVRGFFRWLSNGVNLAIGIYIASQIQPVGTCPRDGGLLDIIESGRAQLNLVNVYMVYVFTHLS